MTERITLAKEGNEYTILNIGEDFTSLATLERKTGETKTGKKWSRLQRVGQFTLKLSRYKDGRPMVNAYEFIPPRRNITRYGRGSIINVSPRFAASGGGIVGLTADMATMAAHFLRLYNEKTGSNLDAMNWRNIKAAIYPVLGNNSAWTYQKGLGRELRLTDARAFVEAAFGRANYRRDLLRAVGKARDTDRIALVREARGLVPSDWLVDALRGPGFSIPPSGRRMGPGVSPRSLFKALDRRAVRRLISAPVPANAHYYADTLNAWQGLMERVPEVPDLPSFSNWDEAHEWVWRAYNRAQTQNSPVRQDHPVYQKLDGMEVVHEERTLRLVSVKQTHDLIDWGNEMSNCIGSYTSRAVNHSSLLFGVYEGGELVGNMELNDRGHVRQLVGKYNATPDFFRSVENAVGAVFPTTQTPYWHENDNELDFILRQF